MSAPKKVATLFGINYAGTPCELRGCINDVNNVANILRKRNYGDVRVLTESTRYVIEREMTRLRLLSWTGITDIYVHVSSHGCQVLDTNGDERDGFDECIAPFDYARSGVITDDYFAAWVKGVNPNTRVSMVFDCCHSGTIVDLPYVVVGTDLQAVTPKAKANPVTRPQPVLVMSGCADVQTSADAFNVGGSNAWSGALTSCFTESIADAVDVKKMVASVTALLKKRGFDQVPQLTSTHPLDQGTTEFIRFGK